MVRRGMMVVLTVVFLGAMMAQGANASGRGPWAFGSSGLTAHDVFGLKTLKLKHFEFFAVQNPDGTAKGWFRYEDIEDGAPFTARGPVTCVTVIGKDAWVGATITHSNDSSVVGLGGWWHVTDNGGTRGASRDITTFLGVGSLDATAAFCADYPPYAHPFEIQQGNITVRQ